MRFNYKTMIEDPEQREKLKLAQEAIAFQNADKFIEEASSLIASCANFNFSLCSGSSIIVL